MWLEEEEEKILGAIFNCHVGDFSQLSLNIFHELSDTYMAHLLKGLNYL